MPGVELPPCKWRFGGRRSPQTSQLLFPGLELLQHRAGGMRNASGLPSWGGAVVLSWDDALGSPTQSGASVTLSWGVGSGGRERKQVLTHMSQTLTALIAIL